MIGNSFAMLALTLSLAQPVETHTIKFKKSAKGDVVHVEDSDSGDTVLIGKDSDGNIIAAEKEKDSRTYVYKETIVEMPQGADKPTGIKRDYAKARKVKNANEEILPYEGKTVLIQKKGNEYSFAIEGGKQLKGNDAEDLDEEFNQPGKFEEDMEDMFVPGGEVKVGETWKVNAKKLLKDLSDEMAREQKDFSIAYDIANTRASTKLLKVYEKEGRKFGQMNFSLAAPIKEFSAEGVTFKAQEGSILKMRILFDGCIDGTVSDIVLKMDFQTKANAVATTADGERVTAIMDVSSSRVWKETELKRK